MPKKKEQNTDKAPLLYTAKAAAGFPLPGDDSVERALDLNALLIDNPTSTFFVRAEGNSMEGSGIISGDILVVDRSVEVKEGAIVVAALFGELVVKRIRKKGGATYLVSDNEAYEPILVSGTDECHIWGTVTASVTQF